MIWTFLSNRECDICIFLNSTCDMGTHHPGPLVSLHKTWETQIYVGDREGVSAPPLQCLFFVLFFIWSVAAHNYEINEFRKVRRWF